MGMQFSTIFHSKTSNINASTKQLQIKLDWRSYHIIFLLSHILRPDMCSSTESMESWVSGKCIPSRSTTSICANLTHLTDAPLQPEHIFHLKIQTQWKKMTHAPLSPGNGRKYEYIWSIIYLYLSHLQMWIREKKTIPNFWINANAHQSVSKIQQTNKNMVKVLNQ